MTSEADQGPWAALLLVLAGALYGAAYQNPAHFYAAWLGIFVMAYSLHLRVKPGWLCFGLLMGGFANHFSFLWYFDAIHSWGGSHWTLVQTTGMWLVINAGMVLQERIPLMLMALVPFRANIPVWLFLPLGWFWGEALTHRLSGLSFAAFLYSQWQIEPVLKLLGHLGWWMATALCLLPAALLGTALYRKDVRYALPMLLVLLLAQLLPALPDQVQALDKIGVVHMNSYLEVPRRIPQDLDVLIWPEGLQTGRPRIKEGPGQGQMIDLPASNGKTAHILGQISLLPDQTEQNSLLAISGQGKLVQSRAKRFLFPAGERPFMGVFRLPSRPAYTAGVLPPVLEINGHKIGALLCLEEFAHALAWEAKAAGVGFISVSAHEQDLGRSKAVETLYLGISVMMAVETGLPLARSSFVGPAALIAPNGRILVSSASGTSGILSLGQEGSKDKSGGFSP